MDNNTNIDEQLNKVFELSKSMLGQDLKSLESTKNNLDAIFSQVEKMRTGQLDFDSNLLKTYYKYYFEFYTKLESMKDSLPNSKLLQN